MATFSPNPIVFLADSSRKYPVFGFKFDILIRLVLPPYSLEVVFDSARSRYSILNPVILPFGSHGVSKSKSKIFVYTRSERMYGALGTEMEKVINIYEITISPPDIISGRNKEKFACISKPCEATHNISLPFATCEISGQLSGIFQQEYNFRCRLQISLLILSEFNRINYILSHLQSSENHRFSDDFRANKS